MSAMLQRDCFSHVAERLTVVCVFWKVIEEIEEMMQESPDPEDDETPTQSDRLSMLSQEIQTLKRSSTSSYEESKTPSFNPCSLDFLCTSNHLQKAFTPKAKLCTLLQPSSNARAYFYYCLGTLSLSPLNPVLVSLGCVTKYHMPGA